MFLTSNFTVKKYSKWCNLCSGNWKWDLGGQAIVKSWDRLAAEPLNWPQTLPSLLWELTQWKKIPPTAAPSVLGSRHPLPFPRTHRQTVSGSFLIKQLDSGQQRRQLSANGVFPTVFQFCSLMLRNSHVCEASTCAVRCRFLCALPLCILSTLLLLYTEASQ